MKFWDSSALVPLLAAEPKSAIASSLAHADPEIVVSFITPVEMESALWRQARITRDQVERQRAHRRLNELGSEWIVIDDYAAILDEAHRVIGRHGLRGADAIQLAAAMIVRGSGTLQFVTFDEELIAAARAEGFPVLP